MNSETDTSGVNQEKSNDQTIAPAFCHSFGCRSTAPSRNMLLKHKSVCRGKFRACLVSLTIGLFSVLLSAENALAQRLPSREQPFDIDNIILGLALLVPGVVIFFTQSKFVTGRTSPQNQLIHYFAVSVVYYMMVWLTVNAFSFELDYQNPRHMCFLLLVGPIIVGSLVGYESQKGYIRRLIRWFRLGNLSHPLESAWDWKFVDTNDEWVIVTLKDGTRFRGFYGKNSFASSDPQRRDIYIEWIYDIDENGYWTYRGKGLLVAAGEIKTVEFLSHTYEPQKEVANE